jgi:hypothetical protein
MLLSNIHYESRLRCQATQVARPTGSSRYTMDHSTQNVEEPKFTFVFSCKIATARFYDPPTHGLTFGFNNLFICNDLLYSHFAANHFA